ncbi:Flp pilus assembly protein TadB [Halorubrum alkaliphilum]|uniref:Flp pilus assembly protein TadB n=1 Tax=Halorubrum alkaliphilum TaxID=261290 RepID=A0A8T4GHX0_9EURY|nr:type II secretion system F family protein [Halorubrum alkaliphilum]MBP1923011.1 Flp pilus assembly protein TadB [Halorubrum alkaliphilum]
MSRDGPSTALGERPGTTRDERAGGVRESDRQDPRLSGIDRWIHALFARHADDRRHDADRRRYRGCDPSTGFETYLARTYALSWVTGLAVLLTTLLVGRAALPEAAITADAALGGAGVPLSFGVADVPETALAVGVALAAGGLAKRATIAGGGLYLRWLVSARRTRIERTLPGAVRYLDALSSGSDDARTMLARVAANDAYGGTAVSFRKALNAARLTGSLGTGLGRVARDTPSRDLLAPFLLKFRQHVSQGDEALAAFLGTESRLLAHRQEHARTRARRYLKPLAELFVLVLVLPALLVIAVTVASVFAPTLSRLIDTPIGAVSPRAVAVYVSMGFLLAVGAVGIAAIGALRPIDSRRRYRHPGTLRGIAASASANPASASVLALVPAAAVAGWLAYAGYTLVNVTLLSYVVFAVPVGLVAARRDRIDDAKDRRIAEFVYAVSEHASSGRPFPEAVETVAHEADLGVLRSDVSDLAFNLSLTTTADGRTDDEGSSAATTSAAPSTHGDVRAAALDRFVDRVGTPLAERTIGIVSGALNAGSTVDDVFETLRVEVDRLNHEKRALRAAMRRYVAVGWVAAVAVAGVVAAINAHAMETDRLIALAAALDAPFDPDLFHPGLERFRLYAVAQATMLASGWFAGAAARGRYGALLHSGVLVALCYAAFTLGGLV